MTIQLTSTSALEIEALTTHFSIEEIGGDSLEKHFSIIVEPLQKHFSNG